MSDNRNTWECASCPVRISSGSRCERCRLKRNAALKEVREEHKRDGICFRCSQPAVPGILTCEEHRKSTAREGYFIERNKKRIDDGLCIACPNPADRQSDRCTACRKRANETQRRQNKKAREIVLKAYGEKCACCGENEEAFLSIDHVNGGGTAHRKEIRVSSGKTFYRWLINNNFPDGFQTLCMNCNVAKWKLGVCPHQTKQGMRCRKPESQ